MKQPRSFEKESGGDGGRKIALYFSQVHVSAHESHLVHLVLNTPEYSFEDEEIAKLRREIPSWHATAKHLAESGYPGIFPVYLRDLLEKAVA